MKFTLIGMFYGYPMCCIADMIERWESLVYHGNQSHRCFGPTA